MDKLYMLDGEILEGEFYLSGKNRAFRYGDGLFETIKVSQGHPLFYRSHYSRLVRGLDALNIEVPGLFSFQYFFEKLKLIIARTQIFNGTLRIQAFRSGEGKYTPRAVDFSWVVEIQKNEHDDAFFEFIDQNYELGVFDEVRKDFSKISFFKSCNALPYVLAGYYANQHNLDNVLILNSKDEVVETVAENIFVYNNGVVATPPIESGAIDGIMRSMLKKLLKWNKIDFEQKRLTVSNINDAEEVFLTNSVKGIIPVKKFQNKSYTNEFSKGLQLKLNERVAQILQSNNR